MSIRQEFNEIFELMILENSMLDGRLIEARANIELLASMQSSTEEKESPSLALNNKAGPAHETQEGRKKEGVRFKQINKDQLKVSSYEYLHNEATSDSETGGDNMEGITRASDADISEVHSESENGSRPKKKKTKITKKAIKEKRETQGDRTTKTILLGVG